MHLLILFSVDTLGMGADFGYWLSEGFSEEFDGLREHGLWNSLIDQERANQKRETSAQLDSVRECLPSALHLS